MSVITVVNKMLKNLANHASCTCFAIVSVERKVITRVKMNFTISGEVKKNESGTFGTTKLSMDYTRFSNHFWWFIVQNWIMGIRIWFVDMEQ